MQVVESGAIIDSKSRSYKLSYPYFNNNLRHFVQRAQMQKKMPCATGKEEEKER